MIIKSNVDEDGVAHSEIVQAASNPHDWSELVRRLSGYFKAHFSEDHQEWLNFLASHRVILAKKDRRELQKREGRWCRVTSNEWHMIVDGGSFETGMPPFARVGNARSGMGNCILFVPQETVEKLIVLEEI